MKMQIAMILILSCFFGPALMAETATVPLEKQETQKLQETKQSLGIGTGFLGVNGLIGVNYDRYFESNQAVSLSAFVDLAGPGVGVSYKIFSDSILKHNPQRFWEKCFYLWECDSQIYGNVGLQYIGAVTSTLSDSNGSRTFEVSSGDFAIVGFGFHDSYQNRFYSDINLSYRTPFAGNKTSLTDGVEQPSDHHSLARTPSVGLALSFGVHF